METRLSAARRSTLVLPGLVWLVGLVWLLLLTGCYRDNAGMEPLPVRIAIPVQPSSALMLVARAGGFFERAGLKPTYEMHPSGKRALLESFIPGNADIVSASDLPVMENIERRNDLRVLTTIQSARSVNAVLARADRGITSFADLDGRDADRRDVGVQEMSAVHYFLDRAIRANGGDPFSLRYHYVPIEDLVGLLAAGDLDAISIREPFLSQGVALLGENAVVLEAPWVYPQFELLVTSAPYAKANPEVLARTLRALLEAERFLYEYPDQAQVLLAEALSVSIEQTRKVLENTINRVVVPQSVFPSLEEQLRWIADRSGIETLSATTILDYFHEAPLLVERPERVGIAGTERISTDE